MMLLCLLGTAASAPEVSTFFVYRAESTASPYHWHLQNSNAANEAGVLSYIHSEVIPKDMGSCTPPECIRKFNIDVIMRFQVTVQNPAPYPTPPLGSYVAFDGGVCTVPGCQEKFNKDGYFIGTQDQSSSVRHQYLGGVWYSFPYGGLCNAPDGSHNCTYIARPSGKLKIDDFVNSQSKVITPNFKAWCLAGGVEFARAAREPPGCCTSTQTLPFWDKICDADACANRVALLKTASSSMWNTTLDNGCDTSANANNVFLNTGGGSCVSKCPVGTFPNWNYECTPCTLDMCAECTWPSKADSTGSTCIKCVDDAYWESGTCVLHCTSHHFPNEKTKKCEVCYDSCGDCTGPNQNQCTTCAKATDYLAPDNSCGPTCPVHTYPSAAEKKCLGCSAACLGCSGPADTECTSCNADTPYLEKGKCVTQCGAREWFDDKKVCGPCDANCDTCQAAATHCTSCVAGSNVPYLFENTCRHECPSHTYANDARVCKVCAEVCKECVGPLETDCRSCPANVPYLQNTTCVTSCLAGFYPDKAFICQLCKAPCAECSDITTCTKCVATTPYLYNGSCVNACPDGYSPNSNNVCDKASSKTGLIIGLVAGGVVLLGLVVFCVCRRKRGQEHEQLLSHSRD